MIFSLDVETVGIDPSEQSAWDGIGRILCWSMATANYGAMFYTTPKDHPDKPWEVETNTMVLHGGSFDLGMLHHGGCIVKCTVHDTQAMARCLWPNVTVDCSLKGLMRNVLGMHAPDYVDVFRTREHRVVAEDYRHTKRKVGPFLRVPTLIGGDRSIYTKRWTTIPLEQAVQTDDLESYAIRDAVGTLKLYHHLRECLQKRGLWGFYTGVWQPGCSMLVTMMRNGLPIDAEQLRHTAEKLFTGLRSVDVALHGLAPNTNFASPKQVAKLLYEDLQYGPPAMIGNSKAPKKNWHKKLSTDETALRCLDQQKKTTVPGLLLQHRKLTKTVQFCAAIGSRIAAGSRVRSQLVAEAETGRVKSKKPNLQNLPNPMQDPYSTRSIVSPGKPYVIVSVDYSQLEVRVAAHYLVGLGSTLLAGALAERDIHAFVAKTAFPELRALSLEAVAAEYPKKREAAKTVIYSVFYGKGTRAIASQLGGSTAAKTVEAIKESLGFELYQEWAIGQAYKTGGASTIGGRVRELPDLALDFHESAGVRSIVKAAERQALNTPIQGSAADIVMAAMAKLAKSDLAGVPILQVHDEILYVTHEDSVSELSSKLKRIMESVVAVDGLWSLAVPLVANVKHGVSWLHCK